MSEHQGELFDREPPPWEVDDQSETCVARIVFSEMPFGPFDYQVPDTLRTTVVPGVRVRVPLGRGNRRRIGYCIEVENHQGTTRRLKPVDQVMDRQILVSPTLLRLAFWISDYYLCPIGQVLDTVIPADVRLQAGTRRQVFLQVAEQVADQIDVLKLPAKQAAAIRILAASSRGMTPGALARAANCTIGPIQALRRKKLVCEQTRRVQQKSHDLVSMPRQKPLKLNPDQQTALKTILKPIRAGCHETIVVHGVTGSGKTEVYIRAIDEVIHYGRQAIVLVPEISLTPQTRRRFRSRFQRVAVLHSHLTAAERNWHWQQIARSEIQVVVGARSAIFAPTPNLGLIVVDEEHDTSFKQDTAPRYHARDVAVQRAYREDIPLVLGSATPSLESWFEALQGVYQLVDMPRRVSNLPLPDVATIDLRSQGYGRRRPGAISTPLYQAIKQALEDGGQVILLLNRRGYSTTIQCPACGHVVKCPDCDIALTHHREGDKAICHYCDYVISPPSNCPHCQFDGIRYSGQGTQRLEAEVRARFRDVPCLRMDSDSMQKRGSHETALDRFRSGEIKILLGTQMIAKGLDFPNVTLVGVINADTALHFPDFRAAERTFQLVTQVAGRTGRGRKGGRVLVQTYSPEHPAIQAAAMHDYQMFARQELPIRREYGYPPITKMIRLVIRGPLEATAEQFADHLADRLEQEAERRQLPLRVLGPAEAPIARIRGKYRFHILLQGEDQDGMRSTVLAATEKIAVPEDVQWIVDVDPVSLL